MIDMKNKFAVSGMTCSACSARVEKAVSKLSGIQNVSVNLLTNSMTAEYDDSISSEDIINAVREAGYGANLYETKRVSSGIKSDTEKNMLKRLISSVCLLIPLMYISMGHMMGLPIPSIFTGHKNALNFALIQLVFCIPIMIINYKYYTVGFKNLFKGAPNMDSLIAIGSGSAFVYGVYAIIRIAVGLNSGDMETVSRFHMDLYFESAATILTLITVGKYLESRSKSKTSEAIDRLLNLSPETATVIKDGRETEVLVEEIAEGDIVLAKAGERIAVDGEIIEGEGSLDQSAITGESVPVSKTIGETVISATMLASGYIKYKATRVGENTTLSQIIKLVEEASSSKAPIAKIADKVSGIFVPIVIIIAIVSLIIWLVCGASFEFAMSIAISILVVSCPCALGLATPVAIMVGTGKSAQNGILIKSGEALEALHNVTDVVLDKTGTLTEGKPGVTDIISVGIDEKELIVIAGSIEKMSEHPLADAIVRECERQELSYLTVKGFKAEFGKGVYGEIDSKGYYIGNSFYIESNKIDYENIKGDIERLSLEGKTPLIVADENCAVGIIAVADKVKPTSFDAVNLLKKSGVRVTMLTGDNKNTAEAVRKKLGIDNVIANVLPQEKESVVASLQKIGNKVAMVGDGINDAPALARADVGIAIGAGVDVAIESADVVLMKNDILDVCTAIDLSKAVIKNIKENLFWAFFYNTVGIPIAAGVFYHAFNIKLSPMLAAAAMSLSSVCVVANALRLRFFKPKNLKNKSSNNGLNNTKEEKDMFGKVKCDLTLKVEGMSCSHCSGAVEAALNAIDGVKAEVNLKKGLAYINLSKNVDTDILIKAVEDAGYKASEK